MSTLSDASVLLLNADFQPLSYSPLSTISWQEAVRGVFNNKYSVVSESSSVIRSPTTEIILPSVVSLRQYKSLHNSTVTFTRHNLFLRDEYKCQYCGFKFKKSHLTFDHVLPQSKGGLTTWENIVAACAPCNLRKSNKSGIKPLRKPFKPTQFQMKEISRRFPPQHLPKDWISYIYWDLELLP